MSSAAGNGGLSVTPQMRKILDKPGLISVKMGSERLRKMFQQQFAKFNPNELPPFALACMCGKFEVVKNAVESGTAPDLTATQTPFKFSYVSLTVLGAQRLKPVSPGDPSGHLDTLAYLITAGASPDIPDISGLTALHHACTPPIGHGPITKLLLEKGANINAQNRFGEVPIFFPFQGGDVALVDILMEHGADLDIADANGDTPRSLCTVFGAEITAAVQRWERKRKGEAAPLQEKRCENCMAKGSGLRQCARCHLVRYCSTECQRAHWKTHKPICRPFSAETTVTLRPIYRDASSTISRADLMRQYFGLSNPNASAFRPGMTVKGTSAGAENKGMVIKVQVPVNLMNNGPANTASGSLFIYNKKRDFVCTVERASNPAAYDSIAHTVRTRGVGGAKAYFVSELKSPEELVINISEVLAEQPF